MAFNTTGHGASIDEGSLPQTAENDNEDNAWKVIPMSLLLAKVVETKIMNEF